jgi:signal transduction histidine kinase
MEKSPQPNREQTILLRNCIIYVISWTIVCLLATSYNIKEVKERTRELVQREERILRECRSPSDPSGSSSLPPSLSLEKCSLDTLYSTHFFFWGAGLFIICLSFARNRKRMAHRLAAEALLKEQSEKIQIFAYSVAHDLKNPVIAIESLARLLNRRQGADLDDKSRQFCAQIEQSAQQVSALIEQINAFISSKEQPLALEPFDLREICHIIHSENEQRLRQRHINWIEPATPVLLEADRMVLLRVLRNLVDNALKYGGDTLTTITISHQEGPRFHTLQVGNDGKPIAPEDCRLIFQRYKRTCEDNKIEGTGLGLAIVRDLVGLHGGQVWVESDGMRGVLFSFTIAKPGRPPG